ncbi:MAG TPA: PorV/PorQ family protein [Candidatus Kapabacteria bacterium]|nr:PorV/PorQ family protein [Candidatus Kapabacteria bacterium]
MNKIYLILISLCAFAFVSGSAFAENNAIGSSAGEFSKVGGAGGQFLKIGVGARATSMAGAYCSVVDDLSAIHWNPAGLAKIKTMTAEFSYNQWFATYSHNFGALAMPVGSEFTAALSVTSLGSGDIPITTIERPNGSGASYTVQDVAIGLTFAGYLTDQFSFGVTAKYVNNSFASLSSGGLAFDVGTLFDTQFMGIKLGFSIHNLGLTQSYTGADLLTNRKLWSAMNASPLDATYNSFAYSLPLIFRAGVSSEVYKDEENAVLGSFDFSTFSDVPEQFAIGAEYVWKDLLALRGGYVMGQDQLGLAGGFGIKYDGGAFGGRIDYSINPTKNLGLVNRITVGLQFGE